jgi:hypothetical protein
MVNRSPASNAFEFVTIAALRSQQLQRGCIPRVIGNTRRSRFAQMEVVAGLVTRLRSSLPIPSSPC